MPRRPTSHRSTPPTTMQSYRTSDSSTGSVVRLPSQKNVGPSHKPTRHTMRRSRLSAVFRAPPSHLSLPSVSFMKRGMRALAWGTPPTMRQATKLVIVRVKGDGRCLYRSIARSLADEESRQLSPHLETKDADALRHLAWRTMCVERAQEFMRRNIVEGSLRTYCAQMRSPSFFAGEAEILALSDALKIPISVFLDSGRGSLRSIATYGEKYKKKTGKTIRVLYNGTNHYNAVLSR